MDKKVNFYFAALLGTNCNSKIPVLVMSSTLLVSLSLALPLELMDR